MEGISSATNELDLGSLLPNLSTLIGWIEFLLGLAVMIGPLLLLGFGLLYLFRPPKEANFGIGYRCWWGMSSLEAWQFTQKLAGKIWTGLGGALTIFMLVICISFGSLDPLTMAMRAGFCLLCQIVLISIACVAINIVVMVHFDKDGFRRGETE